MLTVVIYRNNFIYSRGNPFKIVFCLFGFFIDAE